MPYVGAVRTCKTWKASAVELFTRQRQRTHQRRPVIATSSSRHYRKPDAEPTVSGAPEYRNSGGTTTVSWQRFRPLPIPTATTTTTSGDRLRGGTTRTSSRAHPNRVPPPTRGFQQPLLSSISIDVDQVGTVSYGVRETPFPFSAVSNRRRQIESTDSSSTAFLLPPSSSGPFGRGPSAAWLPAPDVQVARPPLPTPRPISVCNPATSSSHNNDTGNDENSPYYFKLDPALTQKNRGVRSGCEADRRRSLRRDVNDGDFQAAISTGCFMCDTDVMMSS